MTSRTFALGGYGPRRRSAWDRLTARDSIVWRMDWVILLAGVALAIIGSLLVYSATRNRTELNQGDPRYFLVRHVISMGIGIALMIGTVWLGHRRLRSAVPVLYGLTVLLALCVLTPLGATINGSRAWLNLGGGFTVQPAEFIKITVILGMAMLLAAKVDAGDQDHPDHAPCCTRSAWRPCPSRSSWPCRTSAR